MEELSESVVVASGYIRILRDKILGVTVAPLFAYQVRRKTKRMSEARDYLGFALDYRMNLLGRKVSIQPVQIKEEIQSLLEEVGRSRPKSILEIGTANGGTLFLWARAADPDAAILSVDLPGGPFGGGYNEWRSRVYRSFAGPHQKIVLLRRDSHSDDTKAAVETLLHGVALDFLFIDGDHSYNGVKRDFEMYAQIVRKGGLVAFHDIVPHTAVEGVGVQRFWDEVKARYSYMEFVKDWNQGSCGIGLLRM